MPKIDKGRLDGAWGMRSFTAAELNKLAQEHEDKISDPDNSDDAKWLMRRAARLRKLASQKEKSVENKSKDQ